ncbi:hypothetical protein [Streptomyces sp. V3I7]|uniref:hypothetical protein n=1 Tax=Streptomyces sp. V3I7 TaxID=3042278 RepID=UPI0027805E8F|nr:hypothetical protein [Streptomyces sp. V3I7]MDQ0990967.1 hypothetical protein [Streptomyces sp. V3I7]
MTARTSTPAPTAEHHGPRAAADRVVAKQETTLHLGDVRLELPPPDQLAFLAGLGLLTALELIEWPIALAVGVGHELARNRHSKVLKEFGEALEEA